MSRRADTKASRVVREQLAKEQRRRRSRWITVGALALLLVAGLIGWVVYASQHRNTIAVPAGTTDLGGEHAGLVIAGDGPVSVEVYLDFLCPNCRAFSTAVTPTLDQLLATHKIRLSWHPLNFLDRSSTTSYSSRAASSAGCASDASAAKLKKYGEALFANQPAEGSAGLSDDQLIDIGGTVGLNAPAFSKCVREQWYRGWVDQVTAQATQRGVGGTPTVYVNGQVVPNPTATAVKAAVAAAS